MFKLFGKLRNKWKTKYAAGRQILNVWFSSCLQKYIIVSSKIYENHCKQKVLTNPGNGYFLQVYYIYCPKLQYTGPHRAVGNMSDNRCCLTADPGVASLISAWSHTFVEIDHEIISMHILLLSTDSFKKGCCQLQEN